MDHSIKDDKVLVGLEIHQQLGTGRKLFCACAHIESADHTIQITRRLRAARSETGRYDPAAVFEEGKARTFEYRANSESSCLVEQDEEPPHEPDPTAKETALIVASALDSRVFPEIFVMRKMVIDGSNTSGFQRTMLVSQGGKIQAGSMSVGVQSICLEEDAARLIGDEGDKRVYSLDRLGVPLIEIALEPVPGTPSQMREVALRLGRLLRSTGRVARGLGSIRQDVNVSVPGGGIIEVKGVQQLDQLEKVVEFEVRRQKGMQDIAQKIRAIPDVKPVITDVTSEISGCGSKMIKNAIKQGNVLCAILFSGYGGMFGYSPSEGVRLGAEVAQLVRFYGLGGVFHSDELPAYGITDADLKTIQKRIGADKNDAFVMVALPPKMRELVTLQIISRVRDAARGAIAETRLAKADGTTVFLRPRPGAARMYPETDVPPVRVLPEELESARRAVPEPWEKMIENLQKRHGLNLQLASQLYDSDRIALFEQIKGVPANFAASALCSTITNLQRKGLDVRRLTDEMILETFRMLAAQSIPKESIEIIFERMMDGSFATVAEAAGGSVSDDDVSRKLDEIISKNAHIIKRQGHHARGLLMGIAMRQLRGKASGQKISQILDAKLRQI